MDHLVFAAPDLDEGVRTIEDLFGVEMKAGGQHHGFGTRNRLVGLGPSTYMEVVSIDPDQPDPERPRWFGLDDLAAPRLVTWCAAAPDLPALVARGRAAGIDLGDPAPGGRTRPDGSRVSWTVTDPWAERAGGVIPFFIDWGKTRHPCRTLPAISTFLSARLEHPDPATVEVWLRALGLDIPVELGDAPAVIATIRTLRGVIELR
ncbi:MAG: VOC family protein [Gemmatimonadetes bacterium]|nr:VOC family protein [Gemmatimonadota bacterium]MDA1102490.1 VOC family protein [Gemmatimonadota bacterium]